MQAAQTRDNTLQILRGFAITLVLIHHAIRRIGAGGVLKDIDDILICFHMPIFFIISGVLYQRNGQEYERRGKRRFLADKARHLLIPYVFWYVLLWAGVNAACLLGDSARNFLTGYGFAPMSVGEMLYGLFTYEVYYSLHLWFLYVLFLYFLIHCLIGNAGSGRALIATGLLMGLSTCIISYPNLINRFMTWFVFFAFGRYVERHGDVTERIKRSKWPVPLVLFIVLSAVRLLLVDMEPESNQFVWALAGQIVMYATGFLGVLLLYMAARYLNRISNRITAFATTIGDYSYDIYLMHNPYCLAFSATVMYSILGWNAVLTIVIAVILGIVIPMAASRFIIRRSRILSLVMIGKG